MLDRPSQNDSQPATEQDKNYFAPPQAVSLPKGGGAIKGMGEKFAANPVTGTGSMSVPIATSPGRSGFGPQLSLSYDSGAGNGIFGLGWSLSLPSITRKTDKGLPRYQDLEESDVFILSGAEDLVPILKTDGTVDETVRDGYRIRKYRPRIEGLFARIERWTKVDSQEAHWRSISKDNITTLYGKTVESRIADPSDSTRIFSWLICESYDDKGNAIRYEYKSEDQENSVGINTTQAHERNRTPESRAANRYLKRIKYGNRTPHQSGEKSLVRTDWMFEVVFDYGEHDRTNPIPNDSGQWTIETVRNDPFSSYRAGFEVRTYRLCQRVLMFHHFPEEAGVGEDCLVRSLDCTYSYEEHPTDVRNPIYSLLLSVTQTGYKRNSDGTGYIQKSLPPLEFAYSEAIIDETVREVDRPSLENLPDGLDGTRYQWVDLDGEGLSGILTEQGNGWFYKRNLSPINTIQNNGKSHVEANFSPVELVASKPASGLANGAQFLDLAGDGQPDLVTLRGATPGFYERTQDADWENFVAFKSLPVLDWDNPNLKFIDLDGDGHSDILIMEADCFVWYPSLAEDGFAAAERVYQPWDEEKGPRLVFADSTQSIYLADMSGDGLTDIVRIRNGEVCYWPNVGYGRFGAKVTMDNAPWFDAPDIFNQQRILLADIDGSGTTDILYLSGEGVQVYFNQSGNSWAAKRVLQSFPAIDSEVSITAIDLLGNGTACLVWSSPLPGNARRPMRYIDLMGGQKPHLLIKTVNNMGAETVVEYAPSTKFYLQDKLAGTPWVTKLPFPVQVVERVEARDYIARNRFVSRYTYHHGYFDGEEREFRGFGMVEQQDTEAFEDYVVGVRHLEGTQELDPELYQPPVTTRTWFHTGAFLDQNRILHQFRDEYYLKTQHIPEPTLPPDLTAQELRECLRALKGLPLRHEVYSLDGSSQAEHPYSVVENNYEVKLIQSQGSQKHAVFLTYGRESVSLNYDRNPSDPRISHSFNLEMDEYGNVLKSCSVVYGRKITDASLPPEVTQDQQKLYITYGEADYTPDIQQDLPISVYRLRVPCESRSYEITGIEPNSELFKLAEIQGKIASAASINYEVVANGTTPQKRLLSQSRTLFRDNTLNPLPLGQWDTLALGYESYRLAFTPEVVAAHYSGTVADSDFTSAGYVHFNSDTNWWIPSGTVVYPANPASHFYIPIGTRDPLGTETIATFDPYDLLVEQVQITQASWNVVTATNDYRILSPILITDPNKNRSAVEIDALGMVVKSAVMGKAGAGEGDTLDDPTVRMEYELFNWMNHRKPNFVHTFAREQHGAANSRWQESYTYSNGSGGVAMVKAQAHPGKALQVQSDGTIAEVDANPRWIGNGRTILNNKGNPVKQYEPYFSTTHEYENEKILREIGVTPILYYDAIGRNIRTLFPNKTLARVEFNPWMQTVFDANDTVKESQWYADRGSPDPAIQPEPVNDPERRAAWLVAKHANTPGILHSDSLGRSIYAISDYGGGKTATVRSESDLTGRFSKLFDQIQREVASGFVGMAGIPILGESAEKGRRWMFVNVLGALMKTWDEHGREFRVEYDDLHRPVSTFVQESGLAEILFTYVVYGDRHPNAEQLNLLGIAYQMFDQAGMVRVSELDFKGNPKQIDRVLAKDYKNNLNWNTLATQSDYAAIQTTANPALEIGEVFSASSLYDALNRPTQVTLPDGTIVLPTYNEANFLASLQAQIQGQGTFTEFLKAQDYDAKGQRQFAHYGNEVFTRYFYDPDTFRLTNLLTYKSGDNPDTNALQNLRYTYDPIGNITQIVDDAQQTHYFNNAVVKPESLYEYNAIYQLIQATGREHASLTNNTIRNHNDLDFVPQLPHANDANAVRTYTEEYEYDQLGNIKVLRHRFQAQAGVGSGWTRHYRYAYEDDPTNRTNRLSATSLPGDPDAGPYTATYSYDAYGNMTKMPHLTNMVWNFMDQLRQVDLGGGGKSYYVYGASGQRVRKVIERNANTRIERIYLGTVEIYREWTNNIVKFERRTVHISDNTGRIAQVDTKTKDDDNSDPANPLNSQLIRYQYSNHLGSATLETNENGEVISYEEYHPYGTSAYRSAKPSFDLSLKRYRFSGKERDDETGLYYFGARYYAAWLGRWTSTDPAGFVKGSNLFRYCSNNPIMRHDPNGMDDSSRRIGARADQRTINQLNRPEADPRAVLRYFQTHGHSELTDQQIPTWDTTLGMWYFPGVAQSNTSTADAGESSSTQGTPSGSGSSGSSSATSPASPAPAPPTTTPAIPSASSDSSSSVPTEGSQGSPQGSSDGGSSQPGSDDVARSGGAAANYVGTEAEVNQAVRALDNARKAAIGRSATAAIDALPESGRTVEVLYDIARDAYDARAASRAASQSKLWPIARTASRFLDSRIWRWITRNPSSWEGILAKRLAQTGGDLREAYRLIAVGSGSGRASATTAARIFGGLGRGLGGLGIGLSAYGLYEDISTGNYGTVLGNATGIVSGGFILAGAATTPIGLAFTGVSLANIGGDIVGRFVEERTGSRAAGVAAGTLTGAATGAAFGALIGSAVPGIGTAVGAGVGAIVGGVAGFIGSFW